MDAKSGNILSLFDNNDYAQVTAALDSSTNGVSLRRNMDYQASILLRIYRSTDGTIAKAASTEQSAATRSNPGCAVQWIFFIGIFNEAECLD